MSTVFAVVSLVSWIIIVTLSWEVYRERRIHTAIERDMQGEVDGVIRNTNRAMDKLQEEHEQEHASIFMAGRQHQWDRDNTTVREIEDELARQKQMNNAMYAELQKHVSQQVASHILRVTRQSVNVSSSEHVDAHAIAHDMVLSDDYYGSEW